MSWFWCQRKCFVSWIPTGISPAFFKSKTFEPLSVNIATNGYFSIFCNLCYLQKRSRLMHALLWVGLKQWSISTPRGQMFQMGVNEWTGFNEWGSVKNCWGLLEIWSLQFKIIVNRARNANGFFQQIKKIKRADQISATVV